MKKLLALLLVLCMMVSVFAACGGETKETEGESVNAGTEGETEKQTEKQTEKETESETEKQTEKETESETEKQTEKETEKATESETEEQKPAGEVVVLPENTYYCEMVYADYYSQYGVPAMESSIVDAWPSAAEDYDRGLTFCMADADVEYFYNFVKTSGGGATTLVLDQAVEVFIADSNDCYMYNGKPGDPDFGTVVAGNVTELFNGCIASAKDTVGPYIWVGNLWAYSDEMPVEAGTYTFVIYNDDKTEAVAFTEYVLPSFYEHAYYYIWK